MYKRILVPIDGSATSMSGLKEAIGLAKSQGSTIGLFHIVNEFVFTEDYVNTGYGADVLGLLRVEGRKVIDAAEKSVRSEGLEPETTTLECMGGSTADMIVAQAQAWSADLIVMGTHGRRGLRRLAMGSDAENVVRHTTVPVLLVRGPASDAIQVKPNCLPQNVPVYA